jgi:hypothetical protein
VTRASTGFFSERITNFWYPCVVAPDTCGSKGTAALPTNVTPERMKESSDGRPWYKTWSQLTKTSPLEPSVVVCFEDDGRVAVNAELCAASRVYAAGSVAKYPNSSTGQASVAGEGTMNGAEAGRIAALNMSRDYTERFRFSASPATDVDIQSFAAHSLPVWRSDITSYLTASKKQQVPSSLASLGVQALCVGHCDSERYQTRSFWWTNTAAQRRLARLIQEEEEAATDGDSPTRRIRRRNTRRRRKLGLVTPIYGIGVVYFLDTVGRIRGIMTWGLPFSGATSDSSEINQHLLNRMKHVVTTNGGVSALDSEENYHIMNAFLAKESQKLVKLAVRGRSHQKTGMSHGLDGPIDGFTKPLYRYTEVKPAKNSTLNILKRKNGGSLGVMGEDLYARDELALEEGVADEEDETNGANLPTPSYPIKVVPFNLAKTSGASATSLEELNRFLAIQRGWEDNDDRARPGKEDPLWLRPGDEKRGISQKQVMIDYFRSIMFAHRS